MSPLMFVWKPKGSLLPGDFETEPVNSTFGPCRFQQDTKRYGRKTNFCIQVYSRSSSVMGISLLAGGNQEEDTDQQACNHRKQIWIFYNFKRIPFSDKLHFRMIFHPGWVLGTAKCGLAFQSKVGGFTPTCHQMSCYHCPGQNRPPSLSFPLVAAGVEQTQFNPQETFLLGDILGLGQMLQHSHQRELVACEPEERERAQRGFSWLCSLRKPEYICGKLLLIKAVQGWEGCPAWQ